jgi:hypothetical protein
MTGPRYHGRTHLPGGTDPLPFYPGGLDLAYRYEWGIWDPVLDFLAYNDDDTPADNECLVGASVAVLQGQGAVTPPVTAVPSLSPRGSFISGNCSYKVTDDTTFASVTEIKLFPTWVADAAGIGPYVDWNGQEGAFDTEESMVGNGIVWDASASAGYPFVCLSSGHSRLTCRMVADGSLITATNPITFANDDVIQAFWTAFVFAYD